jgi:hypothetical protein
MLAHGRTGRHFPASADLLHLDRVGRIVVDRLGRIVAEVFPARHIDRTAAHREFESHFRIGEENAGLEDIELLNVLLEGVACVD